MTTVGIGLTFGSIKFGLQIYQGSVVGRGVVGGLGTVSRGL